MMITFIVVFYNYKSANNKLIDLMTVLAELKNSAYEIRMEVLASQDRGIDLIISPCLKHLPLVLVPWQDYEVYIYPFMK